MPDRYKNLYKKVLVESWEHLQRCSKGHGFGYPVPKD